MLSQDQLIDHLHNLIKNKDENSIKYYFSIECRFDEGENKVLPIATKLKGLNEFDENIKLAQAYNPDTVLVYLFNNKSDTERVGKKYTIRYENKHEENHVESKALAEIAAIREEMKSGGLKGFEGGELGAIEQRFEHRISQITWQAEKEKLQREFEKKIEDLNRNLNEQAEELMSEREYIAQIEKENEEIASKYEDLRENRYTFQGIDLPKTLGKLGTGLVESLAAKYATPLAGLMGLPPGAIEQVLQKGNQPATASIEGDEPVENSAAEQQIVDFVKQVLAQCTPEQSVQFIQLLVAISQDLNLIDELNLVTKNGGV